MATPALDADPMKHALEVTATAVHGDSEPASEHEYARDEIELARFGKRQQLKVGFLA
jgi:hypothetical protein